MLVTSNSNTSAYFSIVHNTSDTDPLIVLAKNTTTYMIIDNTGKLSPKFIWKKRIFQSYDIVNLHTLNTTFGEQ